MHAIESLDLLLLILDLSVCYCFTGFTNNLLILSECNGITGFTKRVFEGFHLCTGRYSYTDYLWYLLVLDIDRKIPFKCCISCMGSIIGYAPVS